MRVSNDINLALDNDGDVVLVLLDLSSAFDIIDHAVPIKRLYTRFGLKSSALAYIESYLANRWQSICIKDVDISPANLDYGVLQGSVFASLLFSLFIAPTEGSIITHGLQSTIFADDTQILMYLVMRRSEQTSCLSKLYVQDCLLVSFIFWLFTLPILLAVARCFL